jgi:hypothetical protein
LINCSIFLSESQDIRTLEELLTYSKVDLDLWYVKKHRVNSWASNFQVRAELERRPELAPERKIEQLIKEAENYAPVYPELKRPGFEESGYMLQISLFDHHFGQQSWGRETGGMNYDVKIAREMARNAVAYLIYNSPVQLELITFIVGNDFFNVNSMDNTTAKGTSQAEDDRWKKTFVRGWKLWVELVESALLFCPVKVIVVSGNHDFERSFYLGSALECWFHNANDVDVDNGPHIRKYLKWGNSLLGYTHGDSEVKGSLPLLMATHQPDSWSKTKYHTWYKGHQHRKQNIVIESSNEEFAVEERILPSLVAVDDWHAMRGYLSLQQSIAILYH